MASTIAQETVLSDDNLLTEILSNLPIRTLLVAKTVCRRWRFVINHPYLYRRRPTQSGLFLKDWCTGEYEFLSLTGDKRPSSNPAVSEVSREFVIRPFKLLQSCNGLLLFHISKEYDSACKYGKHMIYNPVTAESATVPVLNDVFSSSLAFDPVRTQWPDFTLICIRENLQRRHHFEEYSIEIYSSRTGWRSSHQPLGSEFAYPLHFGYQVYWNGAIHWICRNIENDSMYLNIEKECALVMPKPPLCKGSVSYVGNSNDHLNLIVNFNPAFPVNIYELRRDYSEWFIRYQVIFSSIVSRFPITVTGLEAQKRFSCLSIVREDTKVERPYMVLYTHGSLIRYNLDDGSLSVLHDYGFRDDTVTSKSYCPLKYRDWESAIPFIEYCPSGDSVVQD